MKFLRAIVAIPVIFLFLGFVFVRGIHDLILGWVIGKHISRGPKSGNLIVKDKYGFIEGTYQNAWKFYRGQKL
jgi:hypothetical protein